MAHKTGGSTTRTNRDSISKRLGVKKYGGESVITGNIIIRQKGSKSVSYTHLTLPTNREV